MAEMLRLPRLIRATLSLAVPVHHCPPSPSVLQLRCLSRTQPHGPAHAKVTSASPSLCPPALARSSDLASHEYSLIYAFPAIKGLRAVSRLKLIQTGVTVVLLPAVGIFYLQGQASLSLLGYSAGVAVFAAVMLYTISHYVRRVVGMMYLDHMHTTLKVSHLSFWGHRRDVYLPVSDIMTLGDAGDSPGEPVLRLKRYSCSHTLYFSTRLGQVVDKQGFEKVFGTLS